MTAESFIVGLNIAKKLIAVKQEYPAWCSLSNNDRAIVSRIAEQTPLSCETVAKIFISQNFDINATMDFITMQYEYMVTIYGGNKC